MSIEAWVSQGLLAISGIWLLFIGAFTDTGLVLSLAGCLCALLMNLLSNSGMKWLPLLGYTGACVFYPQLLAFLPLVLYLLAGWVTPPVLFTYLLLLLLFHFISLNWVLALLMVFAYLFYWKDNALSSARMRLFEAEDQRSEQASKTTKELSLLQQNQEDRLKLAIAQERNRIARDIHDNVGHLLSRGILQSAALMAQTKQEDIKADLKDLQTTLNTAMDATRRSVHNTRQDAIYLDEQINSLIRAFSFCEVRYTNTALHPLSLRQKYAVMAIIQEALSNVARHSSATLVNITLSQNEGKQVLLIADNGQTPPSGTEHGLGLAAMEERVRGLSGSIHISAENGFRIFITLPKETEKQ